MKPFLNSTHWKRHCFWPQTRPFRLPKHSNRPHALRWHLLRTGSPVRHQIHRLPEPPPQSLHRRCPLPSYHLRPGINSSNNCVILLDNNGFPSVITRTGVPVTSLGNANPSSFLKVLQQGGANDRLAIIYKIKSSTTSTPATKYNNDSGLLLMTHSGAITHFNAREGSSTFVSPGGLPPDIFGKFNRAAILNCNAVAFTSKVIPDSLGQKCGLPVTV